MGSRGRRAGGLLLVAAAAWAGAACSGRRAPEPGAPAPEPSAEAPPGARPGDRPEPETPGRWYWAYAANRSADVVSRVRFGPEGAAYERPVDVGVMPSETDGPAGIAVAPDGEHWFVTTDRGTPAGRLWKYRAGADRRVASVPVGPSPAGVALADDGAEAWVPVGAGGSGSSGGAVSVVSTGAMTEVARLAACPRPTGVLVDGEGRRAYVLCGGADLVLEYAVGDRRLRRGLRLTPGGEEKLRSGRLRAALAGSPDGGTRCGPAAAAARDGRLWVACRASGDVAEVHAGGLRAARRLPAGEGPAALAVAPGGETLLVANRDGPGTLSVVDLDSGRPIARLGTSRPEPTSIAVSGDGRYAFVSNAAGGRSRGTVDVFDLRALVRVGEVELEHGTAGLAFWRSRPVKR